MAPNVTAVPTSSATATTGAKPNTEAQLSPPLETTKPPANSPITPENAPKLPRRERPIPHTLPQNSPPYPFRRINNKESLIYPQSILHNPHDTPSLPVNLKLLKPGGHIRLLRLREPTFQNMFIFLYLLKQLCKRSNSFWIQSTRIHQHPIILKPVLHIIIYNSMTRRVAMIRFQYALHLIISH